MGCRQLTPIWRQASRAGELGEMDKDAAGKIIEVHKSKTRPSML